MSRSTGGGGTSTRARRRRPGPIDPRTPRGPLDTDPVERPLDRDTDADRPGGDALPDHVVLLPEDDPLPAEAFDGLSSRVPLLLFPVRLETRFSGSAIGRKLKIRIYPDQIHVDDHASSLTVEEKRWARQFWEAYHDTEDDAVQSAARDRLIARLGERRAAWVARRYAPKVEDDGALTFPRLRSRKEGRPAEVEAMPDRWVAIGFRNDRRVFEAWGKPVSEELKLSPTDGGEPWSTDAGALHVDEGMAWLVDYDRAVDEGMAITVELDRLPIASNQVLDTLLVVGVRGDAPAKGRATVRDLLEAHRYSDGLDFVSQGTATNNTDEGESGWSADDADAGAAFDQDVHGAKMAEEGNSNAVRLNTALGLGDWELTKRLPQASVDEETTSAAMNRVLYPVTWGQYLDVLLTGVEARAVSPEVVDWVRDWFVDNVRGGAHLPTLRVGSQPYGLLPVRRSAAHSTLAEGVQYLEEILFFLRESWRTSLDDVPRMDPTLTTTGGADTNRSESDLVSILGSLPHPAQLVLRGLDRTRKVLPWSMLDPVWGLSLLLWPMIDNNVPEYNNIGNLYYAALSNPGFDGIDEQIAFLEGLRDTGVDALVSDSEWQERCRLLLDLAIDRALKPQRDRQPPLDELEIDGLSFSGVVDDDVDDPAITYSVYQEDEETKVWGAPWVEADDAGDGEGASSYLQALKDRVPGRRLRRGRPGASRPSVILPDSFFENEPLLYQLIDPVVEDMERGERTKYRTALEKLSGADVETLHLRLRETLGLAAHRLDAWLTSLARERLDQVRERRAHGVYVGGFGWVHDLRPDEAGASETQGFIHAPSMNHAATAAVLRSGWSAHGTESATSPLAVDVRSHRIRTADWILDGIRQGQGLGDLLGRRFERALHDEGLDAFVDRTRRAVLESQGIESDPQSPVDGLGLLELLESGGLDDVIDQASDDVGETGDSERDRLRAVVDELQQAADAVADAAVTESVHQLLQGNVLRATATLDAMSTGDVPPPELLSARTPAAGVGVHHRLLVLLGDDDEHAGSDWGEGPRATIEPWLEAWVSRLLGAASDARCTVTHADTDGAEARLVVSMSDLGVSALDAVFETAAQGPDTESAWLRRAAAYAAEQLDDEGITYVDLAVDPDDAGDDPEAVSFGDLHAVAQAARSLVGRSRAMTGADLAVPGEEADADIDLDDVEGRVQVLVDGFGTALDSLTAALPPASDDDPTPTGDGDIRELRSAMLALAPYGLPDAVPRAGADEGSREALYAEAWALRERAEARAEALEVVEASMPGDDSDTSVDESARLAHAEALVSTLLGKGSPLLPRLAAGGGSELADAFALSDQLLDGDAAAPHHWLQQVSRVRSEAALLDDLLATSDLVLNRTSGPLTVAQLPSVEGEAWAATSAPASDTGGRVCLLAADRGGLAALTADALTAGLMVDEWVERVPATEQRTGLTFHFDSPSSRPPQSMLLAVTPKGEPWSLDLVVDTLLETLETAQLRAIGPEKLTTYGHHLPAIFPPSQLDAGPQPEFEA